MILIVCTVCACALRVTGEDAELRPLIGQQSEFWSNKYTCYRCGGPAQGFEEAALEVKTPLEIHDVSPQEAFGAMFGLGILAEREVDALIVNALMKEHPVRRVVCKDIPGGNRVVVDRIELWDGSYVHFGSSNEGAVIYRITRPHNYANKVTP